MRTNHAPLKRNVGSKRNYDMKLAMQALLLILFPPSSFAEAGLSEADSFAQFLFVLPAMIILIAMAFGNLISIFWSFLLLFQELKGYKWKLSAMACFQLITWGVVLKMWGFTRILQTIQYKVPIFYQLNLLLILATGMVIIAGFKTGFAALSKLNR